MARLKRRWWRWVMVAVLVLLAMRLESCKSAIPELYPAKQGAGVTVWVVDHGYHSGLILPTRTLASELPWVLDWARGPRWMELGWGDDAFYRSGSSDIPWALLPRALFWPSDSVFQLVAVPRHPLIEYPHGTMIELQLSDQGLKRLLAFVANAMPSDKCCPLLPDGRGIYGNSRFYPARPSYHLFRTCNHWTAQALRAAGLPVTPSYAYLSGNLMYQLRNDPHATILRP